MHETRTVYVAATGYEAQLAEELRRLRLPLLWQRGPLFGTASAAALPACGRWVGVGPPLSADRAAKFAAVELRSPLPVRILRNKDCLRLARLQFVQRRYLLIKHLLPVEH